MGGLLQGSVVESEVVGEVNPHLDEDLDLWGENGKDRRERGQVGAEGRRE